MPGELVVDASVFVDFLVPHREDRGADRVMAGVAWPDPLALLAPDLVFLEVANTLRRWVLHGDLSAPDADHAVARLGRLPIAPVASGGLLEDAWDLRGQITLYDAAYVALAIGLRVPLVTADERLVPAARRAGAGAYSLDDPELEQLLASLEPPAAAR